MNRKRGGDTLTLGKQAHPALVNVAPLPPVLAIAITAKERKDDVKLGQALQKLVEEDLPALNKKMNDAGIPHIVPAASGHGAGARYDEESDR